MKSVAALETQDLNKQFGGLIATDKLSFRLEKGARHALIGPNGAGKTTLVNLMTGVLAPTRGSIFCGGEDITALTPEARVKRGLVRTFQINQLFGGLTPLESLALAVGEHEARRISLWRSLSGQGDILAEASAVAARFGLTNVLRERVSSLPYGKQRLLEIALAFACKPRVLLLDEPAAGVSAAERQELLGTIAALPRDVSVLLIEHDMDVVFSYAERISVLVNGALFAEGTPQEIAADAGVRAVYLGERHDG